MNRSAKAIDIIILSGFIALLNLIFVAPNLAFAQQAAWSSNDMADPMLESHNYWRQELNLPLLDWASDLAIGAQEWSSQLGR